jgi:hypothetical protein
MTGYLFEYSSAAKNPARVSRLLLHLLVRFSISREQDASFKDATIEARRRETRQFILGIIVGALGALGIIAAWLVIKVWLR